MDMARVIYSIIIFSLTAIYICKILDKKIIARK